MVMNMNYPTGKLRARLAAAVAATLLGHASQAIALSFEFGDGMDLLAVKRGIFDDRFCIVDTLRERE